MSQDDLPPEFQRIADLLSQQPPQVRDLFCNALGLAMIDGAKARVIGTRDENEKKWLIVKTVAGDMLEIMRPVPEKVRSSPVSIQAFPDSRDVPFAV